MSEDHRLIWSSNGERQFGYGVRKGVLYVKKDAPDPESITDYEYGVAWNGLTSAKLGGNDPFGYLYADNLKWNRNSGNEYLTGTIEAVNYPEEFMACDGKRNASSGVYVGQQTGKAFGMCYRTELGDEHDQEAGYLIHIIYDMTVGPTDVVYTTIGDTVEIDSYSWDFETLPVEVDGYKPFNEIVIDSRNAPVDKLEAIEKVLYGCGDSMPYLPRPYDLLEMMKDSETVDWISELFNKTISWYYGPEANAVQGYAFASCSSLSYVYFPVCKSIGDSAFMGCSSLVKVDFPECNIINGYAFERCLSLTSVSFSMCSYIGDRAFGYCTSLSSIYFPMCSYIGGGAFRNCSSLRSASFPMCEEIGGNAFYRCTYLSSVSFPMCSYIGNSAFEYCLSLTSVNFPLCEIIDTSAFSSCNSLISVSFPMCSCISRFAFRNCASLSAIHFPVCTIIKNEAFRNCSSLTSTIFPLCQDISDSAFALCSALMVASFPECSIIRQYAFYRCYYLSFVSFPLCGYIGWYAFAYCSSLSNVDLFMCKSIGNSAFYGCINLENVYITYSLNVTSISSSTVFLDTPMENSSYLGHYGSIYVPASLVSAYKSAPNWSYYSDRITSIPE